MLVLRQMGRLRNLSPGNKPGRIGHGSHRVSLVAADVESVFGGVRRLLRPQGYADENETVTKVVEWFGYKLHLLVDLKHEVVLAYQITSATTGDGQTLPSLLKEAQGNLPQGRAPCFTRLSAMAIIGS
jgi:hypothetical protein